MRKLNISRRIDGFWSGVAAGSAASVDVFAVPKPVVRIHPNSGMISDREALNSDARHAEERFRRSTHVTSRRSTG